MATGRETAYILARMGVTSTSKDKCVLCLNLPLPPCYVVMTAVDGTVRMLCERCLIHGANALTSAENKRRSDTATDETEHGA